MNENAKGFLAHCFAPGSTIALLLRTESSAKTQQRIVTLEQALDHRYLGWLAHENHNGANVYVAANPLRPGSRRRTKESIASVRHLYLDIDEDGEARLAALRASDAVPSASAILSTSPGKYQVFWRVEGFNFEQQEATLKHLAVAFGGDPACTDCNRVLRIPGFLNRKYSPTHCVTVEYGSDDVWRPQDFDSQSSEEFVSKPQVAKARLSAGHKDTRSEHDWGWVCLRIAQGEEASKLTRELASRRFDKASPLYYAQRTVDMASARQWFLNGAPMDDVITMLMDRRRFELPASHCSARAREIAATAQRMATRQKFA